MKLYVVMPVINCLEFTKAAIRSIKTECSLILIDNNSNDGTGEWFNSVGDPDKDSHMNIYIRNEPAKSVAASWNQGIGIAFEDPECKYVAILNNDILLHPKTLDHLMAFMDKSQYLMVTADNVKDRMSPEVMMQMELPNPFTDFDLNEISDWRAEGPDFSCFMLNRETIEHIGWFDENFEGAYCEDWDYHARFNRAWRLQPQGYVDVPRNRLHAKRLSTAPYFHFASQTIKHNTTLQVDISTKHGKNRNYYMQKWGGDHPVVMDGNGNMQPFGDPQKNWRQWEKRPSA